MSFPNPESPISPLRSAPSLGQNQDSLPEFTELVATVRQLTVDLAEERKLRRNFEVKLLATKNELVTTKDELVTAKAEAVQFKEQAAHFSERLDEIDRKIKEKKDECKDHKMKAREADRDSKIKGSEKDKHRYMMWSSFVFALLCSILALVVPQIDKQNHPTPGAVSVVSTPSAGAGLVAIGTMVASYFALKDARKATLAYTDMRDDLNGCKPLSR